jgi:hypothetical protein
VKKHNQSIFNSLENFIQYAAKQKLWVFASTFFVASFLFAVRTFYAAPEGLAKLERNLSNLEIMVADHVRAANVTSAISSATNQINTTRDAHENLMKAVSAHQNVHPEELVLAVQTTTESHHQLTIAIATIRGSKFHDPRFSGYTDDISENLQAWDEVLLITQVFLIKFAMGNWEVAQQHADILTSFLLPRNFEYQAQLNALKVSFNEQAQALLNEIQTSNEEINADLLFLRIKLVLSLLALGYDGVFLLIALLGWRRRHLAQLTRSKLRARRRKQS